MRVLRVPVLRIGRLLARWQSFAPLFFFLAFLPFGSLGFRPLAEYDLATDITKETDLSPNAPGNDRDFGVQYPRGVSYCFAA